uniref:Uncharacterized protein n=1 Tax=viral metagenome TaxID=1070528 RepID=A0A6M3JAQ1_9ZZZZ
MKKLAAVLIIAAVCSIAFAAVQLTITIPDEYTTRVVKALRACENTHVSIHFQGSRDPNDPNAPDFSLDVDYRLDSIPAEGHADYGKRFITTMLRNVVVAYETKVKTELRQAAIDAIPIVDVNVPDGVVQ